jgi:hypothetical protein
MHVSLDSALGRQRRLNSVGESVLQIAPSAAAAYSLRSLTGGDPKVVRVRRGSDNHEQDFTASKVSSGALTSFVNAQVVAPLDIQALSATGRDGNFLIASAAYSLRSLGTRQATLAATGDTVARANGKFVAQVRRSSDDALKSFTADEVTDGTLLAFVGTGGSDNGFVKTWYDQSVTNQAGDTATGNHAVQATAAEQPHVVKAGVLVDKGIDFDGVSAQHLQPSLLLPTIQNSSVFAVSTKRSDSTGYVAQINRSSDRLYIRHNFVTVGNPAHNFAGGTTNDVRTLQTVTGTSGGLFTYLKDGTSVGTTNYTGDVSGGDSHIGSGNNGSAEFDGVVSELIVYQTDQTDNRTAIEANIGEVYNINLPAGVDPLNNEVDGFVETWYDQSGNGRDSINTTATQQPIIVDAGVFQDGLKFTHADTTNGKRLFVPRSAAELGDSFALVWVGKATESDTSFNNLLGGTRGVQGYAAGTAGISIKSSDGTIGFINEDSATSRVSSNSSTTTTLNEDFVAFATYEDAGAGPELIFQVDGGHQFFSFASSYVLTSTKDIGIMNASNSVGGYRIQESPTGVCREVLVYDTHQGGNRVALVNNINNQYNLF